MNFLPSLEADKFGPARRGAARSGAFGIRANLRNSCIRSFPEKPFLRNEPNFQRKLLSIKKICVVTISLSRLIKPIQGCPSPTEGIVQNVASPLGGDRVTLNIAYYRLITPINGIFQEKKDCLFFMRPLKTETLNLKPYPPPFLIFPFQLLIHYPLCLT
jgi:hypothetical protein